VHPTRLHFLQIRVLYGIGNSGLAIAYGLWLGLRDFLALAMLPLPPWPSTPSTPPPLGMRCGILIRFWSYTRSFRLRQSAKLSQADQNHWPTNPRRASETVLPLVCFWAPTIGKLLLRSGRNQLRNGLGNSKLAVYLTSSELLT